MNDCIVCGESIWKVRLGALRDAPNIGVIECVNCGVVIPAEPVKPLVDYASGSMHNGGDITILDWREECKFDDERRASEIANLMEDDDFVLDIGTGAGGFLHCVKKIQIDSDPMGIELEERALNHLNSEGFKVWNKVTNLPEEIRSRITIVTMFHVLEHISDPRKFLGHLISQLPNMRLLIIEVPCSEDPLLSLYQSDAFSRFTYWSHHEQLHSKKSLELLLKNVFSAVDVKRLQRYGLGNHLGWLAKGRPGGQIWLPWANESMTDTSYRADLISQEFSDTLWATATMRRGTLNSSSRRP